MRVSQPVRPARAEDPAVDEQHGFSARVQVHYDSLAAGLLRHREAPEHPGVFPGLTPYCSFRPGFPGVDFRLRESQGPGSGETFQRDFSERVIQVCLQGIDHMPQLFADFINHAVAP